MCKPPPHLPKEQIRFHASWRQGCRAASTRWVNFVHGVGVGRPRSTLSLHLAHQLFHDLPPYTNAAGKVDVAKLQLPWQQQAAVGCSVPFTCRAAPWPPRARSTTTTLCRLGESAD
ncbi:hypothetical protein HXX76_010707 [Chlamydomonas incerta]|uniref:Uncharacterized protein n=1 Tax=Chlamydomonas incerta TaxID=51695 RepID=A0A835SWD7_CHLIN|nr:hypothetical protein HXX76_010707 [Chlamydomonas incerta]|eukprot:KAG2429469.1 hypothetical protein HXX76_010707 [Chlamydomonas incerta]